MASDFRCLLLSPENAPFDEFIFSIKFCEIFQGFKKNSRAFPGFPEISRASKIFQGFPGFPGPVRTLISGSWVEPHCQVVMLSGFLAGQLLRTVLFEFVVFS